LNAIIPCWKSAYGRLPAGYIFEIPNLLREAGMLEAVYLPEIETIPEYESL